MAGNNWKWKKIAPGRFLAVTTCQRCGLEFNNGNVAASKYCPECAKIVQREKTRERVRKWRANKKADRRDHGA